MTQSSQSRSYALAEMITPSPTSKINPIHARGLLLAHTPATTNKPAHIVFGVPNTSYELHLIPTSEIVSATGKRLIGIIRVEARRIDVVQTGGQFIEPVFGRPRRVQGSVIAVTEGAVVVDAGTPVHIVPTDKRQSPEQFRAGDLVSCDVFDGASFTPAS